MLHRERFSQLAQFKGSLEKVLEISDLSEETRDELIQKLDQIECVMQEVWA